MRKPGIIPLIGMSICCIALVAMQAAEPEPAEPKQDLRVQMLYDEDMAAAQITSYAYAKGGLRTMQLNLLPKNGGAKIAPNGLYAICWTLGKDSGAFIIDPNTGDVITSRPLQSAFMLRFNQQLQMPEELPPEPPPTTPPAK